MTVGFLYIKVDSFLMNHLEIATAFGSFFDFLEGDGHTFQANRVPILQRQAGPSGGRHLRILAVLHSLIMGSMGFLPVFSVVGIHHQWDFQRDGAFHDVFHHSDQV
ncbi:MAG: hypothetical protein GY866_42895, partial [Proteobacteria bacterium]|nr:hypothetical protein [Pseudomonadota bacterium]